MATLQPDEAPLDLREQIARIDKMQAELQKIMRETVKVSQDTELAKPQLLFQGALAASAAIAAVATVVKLFY